MLYKVRVLVTWPPAADRGYRKRTRSFLCKFDSKQLKKLFFRVAFERHVVVVFHRYTRLDIHQVLAARQDLAVLYDLSPN